MLLWHHILWSPTSSCHPALKTDRPYLCFHFSRCPLSWFQSFLYVVDSLNIPTPDSHHLLDLLKHRHWGDSLLIVDVWVSWQQLILSCASLGVDIVFPCCFQLWRVSGEHPAGDGQSEDGQCHSSHRWVRSSSKISKHLVHSGPVFILICGDKQKENNPKTKTNTMHNRWKFPCGAQRDKNI